MKHFRTTGILLLSVLLLTCCKTELFPPTKEKAKQLKTLRKTIEATKEEVKESWVNIVHSYNGWTWYHTKLSDADIPLMTMIPVPVYRMDSVSFYNTNTSADIVNCLTLETQKTDYLVLLKDSAFVGVIRSQYIGKKWDGGDDSDIFPGIAQKCYWLYSKRISFYTLHLYTNSNPSDYRSYAFYDNGKELMEIRSDGSEVPLIQELNTRKNFINECNKRKSKK